MPDCNFYKVNTSARRIFEGYFGSFSAASYHTYMSIIFSAASLSISLHAIIQIIVRDSGLMMLASPPLRIRHCTSLPKASPRIIFFNLLIMPRSEKNADVYFIIS